MTPRRRRILCLVALLPAALFTVPDVASALGGGPWPPHAVAALVTLVGFGALLSLALPGVDPRRGALALFVAAWGALAIAMVVGEAAGALTYDHVVRGSEWDLPRTSGHTGTQGPEADTSGAGNVVATAVAVDAGPTPSAGVLPSGTAAGPLMGGWIVGLAITWAYRRTRPGDPETE